MPLKDAPSPEHVAVGRWIKAGRERLGWSQATLSDKLGISQQALSKLETGRTQPPLLRLRAIADALGADLAPLLRATASPSGLGEADAPSYDAGRAGDAELRRIIDELRGALENAVRRLDLLHPPAKGRPRRPRG